MRNLRRNFEQKLIIGLRMHTIQLNQGSKINTEVRVVTTDDLRPSYGCLKFTKRTGMFNGLYFKNYLCAKLPLFLKSYHIIYPENT